MPGIQVQERHQEIESNCRSEGHDQVREEIMSDFQVTGVFLQLVDYDVDAGEGVVGHDHRVDYHGSEIEFARTLWSVPH